MKAVIIEDEGIAAKRLIRLLEELDPSIEIVGNLDSVRSSLDWFGKNASPDLAFFDIQLADGKSFEILEKIALDFSIVFTTAYDQYAIDAFRVNAIDYLLKPISRDELQTALEKFRSRQTPSTFEPEALISLFQQQTKKYKERFVVKVGGHLKSVQTSSCQVFYSQDKGTWTYDQSQKTYLLDYTMDQIEDLLNPDLFFRISRKYIVNINSIQDIISFSNSRLKLKILNFEIEDMIVARERVGDFKAWLDR